LRLEDGASYFAADFRPAVRYRCSPEFIERARGLAGTTA
jgi:hypothetical protein